MIGFVNNLLASSSSSNADLTRTHVPYSDIVIDHEGKTDMNQLFYSILNMKFDRFVVVAVFKKTGIYLPVESKPLLPALPANCSKFEVSSKTMPF